MPKKKVIGKDEEIVELKSNEIIALPIYRYEVRVSEDLAKVEVYAQLSCIDGDELNFSTIRYDEQDGEIEELVACFKNWIYFTRHESNLEEAARLWGDKFEKMAKYVDRNEPTD